MPNKATARCDAQRCLYCFLHTIILKASLSASVGLHGTSRYLPSLLSTPHPIFLLCFCADEIKDDFDTLGPDAALQAVGNGTGELTEHALNTQPICLISTTCNLSSQLCYIGRTVESTFSSGGCDPTLAKTFIKEQNNYIDSL